jgi:ABC-type sulfate/molybdate transport systems ATPase subunit
MKKSMKSEAVVALTAGALAEARNACREAVEVADRMTRLSKGAIRHANDAADITKSPLDYKQVAKLSLAVATLGDAVEKAKAALRAP